MRCLTVVNASSTAFCKRAAQLFRRFIIPCSIHHFLTLQNNFSSMICHFRNSVVRSFFFFACLACKWSFCIVYVDLIFVALTTWLISLRHRPCNSLQQLFRCTFTRASASFSSCYASSCLINHNSMTLPFPRLVDRSIFSLHPLPANDQP